MSSSDGLTRLKNWQRAEKALVVPSVSWNNSILLFERGARVSFVDESTLVLVNLDNPDETPKISLGGATFACSDELDLELTLADGTKLYLREQE